MTEDRKIALRVLEKQLYPDEHYVSFETAKLLKEKGYRLELKDYRGWPCYATKNVVDETGDKSDRIGVLSFESGNFREERVKRFKKIPAPTLEMVLSWLRKKNIHIVAEPIYMDDATCNWVYSCWYMFGNKPCRINKSFYSYEEAVEDAIIECLNKI